MGKTKVARKPTPTPDESEPVAKMPKLTARKLNMPIPQRATRVGTLLSCGQNEVGQLGLGEDVAEKTRPAAIPGCENVVDIAAGGMHSLYLDADGAVFSFGCNDEGALGRDSSAEGSEYEIVRVELPLPVVRLSTGDSHSACLLEDGRVLAWGSFRDSHGNMGLTLEGNKRFPIEVVPGHKFVDISSGADHLVMLTTDGKVFTVGCGEQGQLGRVTARSSGGESRRGKTELLRPGQVRFKSGAQLMDAIWATTYCTFTRVHNNHEIIAFGLNNYSQLAMQKHEDLFFSPKATTIQNVKSISGGQHHTLLLTNDDRCEVIGRRDYGRLGIGETKEDLKLLTNVSALNGLRVVQVACGESCSFARTADGLVYAWGIGSNHQLGVGSEDDAYEPVLLTGVQVKGKEVLNVNGGGQHTLLLVASADAAGDKKTTTAAAAATVNGTSAAAKTNGVPAKKTEKKEEAVKKPVATKKEESAKKPETNEIAEATSSTSLDTADEKTAAEPAVESTASSSSTSVDHVTKGGGDDDDDDDAASDVAMETDKPEKKSEAAAATKKKPVKAQAKKRKAK